MGGSLTSARARRAHQRAKAAAADATAGDDATAADDATADEDVDADAAAGRPPG
jgi:hypothetical protein